jgi:hypothetical protein
MENNKLILIGAVLQVALVVGCSGNDNPAQPGGDSAQSPCDIEVLFFPNEVSGVVVAEGKIYIATRSSPTSSTVGRIFHLIKPKLRGQPAGSLLEVTEKDIYRELPPPNRMALLGDRFVWSSTVPMSSMSLVRVGPHTGGAITDISEPGEPPYTFARSGEDLFWTTNVESTGQRHPRFWRAPITGGAAEEIKIPGVELIDAVANSPSGEIFVAGSALYELDPQTLAPTMIGGGANIVLQVLVAGENIFFRTRTTLVRVPKAGGMGETVAGLGTVSGDIVFDGDAVYVAHAGTAENSGAIARIRGTTVEPEFQKGIDQAPEHLAAGGGCVYWIQRNGNVTNAMRGAPR